MTFVCAAALENDVAGRWGLERQLLACKNTRDISKRDMVHNHWMPNITVDPQTYEVRADGQLLSCEPAEVLPMAQLYQLI